MDSWYPVMAVLKTTSAVETRARPAAPKARPWKREPSARARRAGGLEGPRFWFWSGIEVQCKQWPALHKPGGMVRPPSGRGSEGALSRGWPAFGGLRPWQRSRALRAKRVARGAGDVARESALSRA